MAKSFHGGIKKQKKLFTFVPSERYVSIQEGDSFSYTAANSGSICVFADERVYVGTVLACCEGSAPILSGVSGTVASVDGDRIVVIADGEQSSLPALPPFDRELSAIPAEEVAVRLSDCAVTSKYSTNGVLEVCSRAAELSGEKKIKLIMDCTSPSLASSVNAFLIKNYPAEISGGIRILMRACNASEAQLVCDDSSVDIIRILESICDGAFVKLTVAEAKHPMQNEGLLVYLAIDKETTRGKKMVEYGFVTVDCEAAVNAYRAAALGERTVTKHVAVKKANEVECVNAPLGSPLSVLIGEDNSRPCFATDELPLDVKDVLDSRSVYVDAGSELLILTDKKSPSAASACIGCGKCEAACPMYLPVSRIVPPTLGDPKEIYKKYSFGACIGCGCCSAVCPSGIEIRTYVEGGRTDGEA